MIKKFFGHLTTVLKHKFWVGYYCFKCGLYWRGLMHDMSKFHPVEFWESVRYYTGTSSPINKCKAEKGYSKAWLHHKGINKHHYEYWQDNFDKGGEALQMPFKYALEMVCDYLGAARAYWGKEFTYVKEWEWWQEKCKIAAMHPQTKDFVDRLITFWSDIEKIDTTIIRQCWNDSITYYVLDKELQNTAEGNEADIDNEI